jgi:hypothetical protein
MDIVQLYPSSNVIAELHRDLIAVLLWVHPKIALQPHHDSHYCRREASIGTT